jgi:uncharacterized phage infection (PIP) family protein YhgE
MELRQLCKKSMATNSSPEPSEPSETSVSQVSKFISSLDELINLLSSLELENRKELLDNIRSILTDEIKKEGSIVYLKLESLGSEIAQGLSESKFISELENSLAHYLDHGKHGEWPGLYELINTYKRNKRFPDSIDDFLLSLKDISDSASTYVTKVTSMEEEFRRNTQTLNHLRQEVSNVTSKLDTITSRLDTRLDGITSRLDGMASRIDTALSSWWVGVVLVAFAALLPSIITSVNTLKSQPSNS